MPVEGAIVDDSSGTSIVESVDPASMESCHRGRKVIIHVGKYNAITKVFVLGFRLLRTADASVVRSTMIALCVIFLVVIFIPFAR